MNDTKKILFEAYLNEGAFHTDKDAELEEISVVLDAAASDDEPIDSEALAEYELAAVKAGFYAGLKAASMFFMNMEH